MQIILIIIGIIILLGIINMVIEFIKEHPIGIVLAIVTIALIFLAPPAAIVLALVWVIYMLIDKQNGKNNKTKLLNYLNSNCKWMGCLEKVDLSTVAPAYVSKKYEDDSYTNIVSGFFRSLESQCIINDKDLHWLTPALVYLEENKMADVYELEKIASEGLKISHLSPDGKLICEAMKGLCATKIVNGQHKYSQIKLEADGIRKELNLSDGEAVPDYYLWAFKLEDTSKTKDNTSSMGNIETEEITADDLGIDI